MSLSRAEFKATLAILLGRNTEETGATEPLGDGSVSIAYRDEPPATLGGLLSLPRATVTLTFNDVAEAARKDFLARFDRTFQRGGG